jgi:hypothetical protein
VDINVKGLQERINALAGVTAKMTTDARRELGATGAQMETDAKSDHRFISRSGNLERSIKHELADEGMNMKLGLVSDVTQSNWRKAPHVAYGTFQHEGTYTGYVRSKAANAYQPTPGRSGSGIKADHFIVRAWDRHIAGLLERVKGAVYKALKEAVENGLL